MADYRFRKVYDGAYEVSLNGTVIGDVQRNTFGAPAWTASPRGSYDGEWVVVPWIKRRWAADQLAKAAGMTPPERCGDSPKFVTAAVRPVTCQKWSPHDGNHVASDGSEWSRER